MKFDLNNNMQKPQFFSLGRVFTQAMRPLVRHKTGELDMKESRLSEEAGQQYATAYDTHYKTKDIHKAFTLYEDIIAAHPDTKEAGYSKSQVQNIVNGVVPKKEIMDSLMKLARIHFDQKGALDAEPASV
jgi:hypothetical protein